MPGSRRKALGVGGRGAGHPRNNVKGRQSLDSLAQGQPCLYITENPNLFQFCLLIQVS